MRSIQTISIRIILISSIVKKFQKLTFVLYHERINIVIIIMSLNKLVKLIILNNSPSRLRYYVVQQGYKP
jgi:hypothetical protein